MAMKTKIMISVAIVLAMIIAQVHAGLDCDIAPLQVCLPVIKDPSLNPTPQCCANLKAQPSECYCEYIKDPIYGKYFNSPGAKKLIDACGVPVPVCHD
ncbi:hypothetical protein DCAR_0418314 [Daucus carota subsp. sativus]|uniref:Bifunctional inhibitor/plant lipid transfer protein/seed storage helical domain-containing protein n=1 Tax=Daucus carota subsp. sativus TaxID=79200 RepID=A0AAF1AXC8_DAUCS|nr:hypothetical protein DCAR_0418314 [Daucus carota subsp. sativus]